MIIAAAAGITGHNIIESQPAAAATHPAAIEQLPGYGKKVGPEVRKELRDSLVSLVRQQKGYEYLGGDNICSGFLINYHGKTLGVTAKHCLPPGSNNFSWAIEKPQSSEPLAKISKWSFKPNSDSAFLSFNSKSETTAFKKLRPLNASILTNKIPELGQQVASIGFGYKTKKVEEGTGILLGKELQEGRTVYVVGAHVANPNAGPYQQGVSGMAFVTAHGELLGSHSEYLMRGENLPNDYVQSIVDLSGGIITPQQARMQNKVYWTAAEANINIKIPQSVNTLLFVQQITPGDAAALESGLK